MLPASHPATIPTMTMTMRLSFDRCMGVPLRDSIFGRDVLDVRRLHYSRSATTPAPAQRSPAALRKATSRRTDDGMPVHSFRSLLADLATLALNKVSLPSNRKHRFDLPTTPTPLQARAFELLGVSPGM